MSDGFGRPCPRCVVSRPLDGTYCPDHKCSADCPNVSVVWVDARGWCNEHAPVNP